MKDPIPSLYPLLCEEQKSRISLQEATFPSFFVLTTADDACALFFLYSWKFVGTSIMCFFWIPTVQIATYDNKVSA
jgi:hypothetical protein